MSRNVRILNFFGSALQAGKVIAMLELAAFPTSLAVKSCDMKSKRFAAFQSSQAIGGQVLGCEKAGRKLCAGSGHKLAEIDRKLHGFDLKTALFATFAAGLAHTSDICKGDAYDLATIMAASVA